MMLVISFIFAILIEIFFPIALAFWITRRFKTDWLLIGVGATTFILSQVVHLPIVTALTVAAQNGWFAFPAGLPGKLINAILLGFLAGVCEEPARWLGYKFLKNKADAPGQQFWLADPRTNRSAGKPILVSSLAHAARRSGGAADGNSIAHHAFDPGLAFHSQENLPVAAGGYRLAYAG